MEIRNKISAADFYKMRKSVKWKEVSLEQLEKALSNSMNVIGIYEENEIVAMGRIVGDYTFKGMLTDIIVKPECQKKGYGKIVVTRLLENVKSGLKHSEKIEIQGSPTAGNRNFYVNCGLEYEPEEQDGVYIWIEQDNSQIKEV